MFRIYMIILRCFLLKKKRHMFVTLLFSFIAVCTSSPCTFTNMPSVHMDLGDPSLDNGACGFGTLTTTVGSYALYVTLLFWRVNNGRYTAAFADNQYTNGASCGECFLLTNPANGAVSNFFMENFSNSERAKRL